MNESEISEMVALLNKEENGNLRTEFAKMIVAAINDDFSLKSEIVEMVNKEMVRNAKSLGV